MAGIYLRGWKDDTKEEGRVHPSLMEWRKPPSCQFTELWMWKQNGAFQFCCLLPGVRDWLPWIFWIPAANGREFCSLASWGPARVKHEMEAGGRGGGGWKPEVKGSTSSRVKADWISSHIHLTIYIFLEKKIDLFVPSPTAQRESQSP